MLWRNTNHKLAFQAEHNSGILPPKAATLVWEGVEDIVCIFSYHSVILGIHAQLSDDSSDTILTLTSRTLNISESRLGFLEFPTV